MQEAVMKRETALKTALENHHKETMTAMDKRLAAFTTAWSSTEAQNARTYRTIWSTWKQEAEAARKKLRSERDAAWKTFRETATKSCRVTLTREENEGQDSSSLGL
jgi:hypothetical protein